MDKRTKPKEKVKNVLFVSIAAPPKGSPESLQVSKYLKYLYNEKLEICLVTEKLPRGNFGWRNLQTKYQNSLQNVVQLIRLPVYYNRYIFSILKRIIPNWFKKPDNERLFISGCETVVKLLRRKPDVIYSRSAPLSSNILALKLKKIYKVPWVMHLSDPWVISPLFSFRGKSLAYHHKMEKECFDNADRITFTSREQINLYQAKYPQYEGKFLWFPNVFDDDEISETTLDFSTKLTFAHTGNMYGRGRSPTPILKAIQKIIGEEPEILNEVSFIFAGFHDKIIARQLDAYQAYNVSYVGALSIEEAIQLQRSATVLIILDLELPSEAAVFFLSKALDYMAARKHIIAITTPGSTIYKFIQHVYGNCFGHQDIQGLADHIMKVIKLYRAKDDEFFKHYEMDYTYSARYNAGRLTRLLLDLSDPYSIVSNDE